MRSLARLPLLLLLVAHLGASAADPDVLPPERWPKTLSDAVIDIVGAMSEEDKEHVRKTKRDKLITFHFGWGTGIRNHYGLWRGNSDLLVSACGKPCHPDEASMIIIEAVWERLQK